MRRKLWMDSAGSGNDSVLLASAAASKGCWGHGESSGVDVMNTVLKDSRLSRMPWLCGALSVLTATVLGCGVAVGASLAVEAVSKRPSGATESAVLLALIAGSALRERSIRSDHRGGFDQ